MCRTVCGIPAAVMVIVPLHVVPAAIPDGLTETVKLVLNGLAVKLPIVGAAPCGRLAAVYRGVICKTSNAEAGTCRLTRAGGGNSLRCRSSGEGRVRSLRHTRAGPLRRARCRAERDSHPR